MNGVKYSVNLPESEINSLRTAISGKREEAQEQQAAVDQADTVAAEGRKNDLADVIKGLEAEQTDERALLQVLLPNPFAQIAAKSNSTPPPARKKP